MKNCISVANVCLLILFAVVTSLGQKVEPQKTPGIIEPRFPHEACPVVTVSCPDSPDVSEPVLFTSTISGANLVAKLTYNWQVSTGVIIEGQGTPAIKVQAVKSQTLTATLDVGGFDPACARTASCSFSNCVLPPAPTKLESYGVVSNDQERAILDTFREQLTRNPGAQGYIFGYGGRRSSEHEAQKAVKRVKEYMVNKLGMNEASIIVGDGGFREERTVELWVVPAGAPPPTAEPTVDPTEVKVIMQRRVRG